MSSSLQAFIQLFRGRVAHTLTYLEKIPAEAWQKVPVESNYLFLGTRVNTIHISALIRHLILAETHWFEKIHELPSGSVMPFPQNAHLLKDIEDGPALIQAYTHYHAARMKALETLNDEELAHTLIFAERKYTVSSLLWQILGHHSYHMGQVDILMRQQNIEPPEYMEWPQPEGHIA